ncbi:alpha beta hydrolase [Brachionus plicatilis]|uniref:Alpha beta hydrolase n=1 Tax=Brachionus plicatilis TaxID=10195 RepID=A0A3M7QP02_BRAPC|nr:alpha beta hydrolase [Brachionus plicatilis]
MKRQEHFVETSVGSAFVLESGESQQPCCLMIHGWSKSDDHQRWNFMFDSLVLEGFRILAIDMPGFGRSQNARRLFKARSEENLIKDGPVDVIEQILKKFLIQRFYLFGLSWGGGVAISLAIELKSRIFKMFLFMPSYTEQKDELKFINTSCMILWIKEDLIHPCKMGKYLSNRIKLSTLVNHSIETKSISPENYATLIMIRVLKIKIRISFIWQFEVYDQFLMLEMIKSN